MKLSEYSKYDATGLGALVNKGAVSATELIALARQAHDALNEKLNAVIEFYDDAETVSGASTGPFAGVPFFRKDIGACEAGRVQEMGSRLFKGVISKTEDYYFQRARASGLRPVGRTTTPEFGVAGVTESALHGVTVNPWNTDVSPGGSSGGSAAAVASGMLPIAQASDAGGSTRTPASFCGLVGLNPSRGRVTGGPKGQDAFSGLARTFVLCRSVRDMAAALDVFSGPYPGDPFIIPQPVRPYTEELQRPSKQLRVGVALTKWGSVDVEPDVLDTVTQTATALESRGHIIEEIDCPCQEADYVQVLLGLACLGMSTMEDAARALGREINADTLDWINLKLYELSQTMPLAEAAQTLERLRKMRSEIGHAIAEYDILLTPVMPTVSMRHGHYAPTNHSYTARSWMEMDAANFLFLGAFNVSGQPSVSLPIGMSRDGLPIGVQVVGKFADEATLVQVARDLEIDFPWANRLPAIHASRI